METMTIERALALTPALEALRPELMALPAASLGSINLDVLSAAAVATGAEPKIRVLRAEIERRFGAREVARLDRLGTSAQAAIDAHAAWAALGSSATVEALDREVAAERHLLFTEAEALIDAGLMKPELIANLEGGNAYDSHAFDTKQLVVAFRASMPTLAGRTHVTPDDLRRVEDLVERFHVARAQREAQTDGTVRIHAEVRARAYALFVGDYDQLRRHVGFLRWHERDADQVCPSLFSGRGRKKKATSDVPTAPPAPSAPVGHPNSNPFRT